MYDILNSSFLHFSISTYFTIILTFCFPIRISKTDHSAISLHVKIKHGDSNFYHKDIYRLGKLACPRVNDDQKKDVDDQKLNSGRPHDYWNFLELSLYNTVGFPHFSTT